MNRKTVLIVLLALAVAATGAFASGSKEDKAPQEQPGYYGPGPGGCWGGGPGGGPRGGFGRGGFGPSRGWRMGQGLEFSEEKVSLTGKLYFEKRMHPELKTGAQEYELMVPRHLLYGLDLKEGQEVSVEGFVAAGEDESYLWVTKAVIDGKEYDLERGARMGWGPRRGRRGC